MDHVNDHDSLFLDVINDIHACSGEWSMGLALAPLVQACDALRYAHSKGIVVQQIRNGEPRYVVSAYSPDGTQARIIGAAIVPHDTLLQILGSLRFIE